MIRFIGALLVGLLMLGSVAVCQWFLTRNVEFRITRESDSEQVSADQSSQPTYSLMLTSGFNVVDDPFALRIADKATPRLVVKQGDKLLLQHETDVIEGEPVALTNLQFTGESVELYIEGSPSSEEAVRPCAIRVQLFLEGVLCDDQTLWSEGKGSKPGSTLNLSLTPRREKLDRGIGGRS